MKDLIIIRGANFYASDFERILDQAVLGLRAGCNTAFAVERANEETLVLVAEVQRGYFRTHGAATIFRAVREAVARECGLAIGEIVLVPPGAVPKTSSGKTRRSACRQAYLDGELRVLATSGAEITAFSEPVRKMRHVSAVRSGSIEETSGRARDIERMLCARIARNPALF